MWQNLVGMFGKKVAVGSKLASDCSPAVRFGTVASNNIKKLVLVPNDPTSVTFFQKVDSLSREAHDCTGAATQLNQISEELDATVSKFARSQRLAIETSIDEVYGGLHEILASLEKAIQTSENLGSATENSSARLLDLQCAKNYDAVLDGLRREISSLNKAVGQYREDAKLIRQVASKHVEILRTKLKVAEKAVQTDHLTKLGNRNAFELQLAFAISRLNQGDIYSLAVIDIDRFKKINDNHGHLCGDVALVEFAKRLTETFSQLGTSVVRLGGDEFAVLYKGSLLQLEAKLERVNSILAKSALIHAGATIILHSSFGVLSLRPEHTPESAFAEADRAMYDAKRSKRQAA